MSPSLRCMLSLWVCSIKSLKKAEAICFSICITWPLRTSKTVPSSLVSRPGASWEVFTAAKQQVVSETPRRLCAESDPCLAPEDEPDTSIRSRVGADVPSLTLNSAVSPSAPLEELDSLSSVHTESCSRSKPSPSLPLDMSSDPITHLQTSTQLQHTESVNSGGGGTISVDDDINAVLPDVSLISCTHRPRMMGRSSPPSRLSLLLLLHCFLWRLNHVWGTSSSSVSLIKTASFIGDLAAGQHQNEITKINDFLDHSNPLRTGFIFVSLSFSEDLNLRYLICYGSSC